jgi:hypothetical protein
MAEVTDDTSTGLVNALNALEDRKTRTVNTITELISRKDNYIAKIRAYGCRFRRDRTQFPRYTIDELLGNSKRNKELNRWNPLKSDNGDCGWMKEQVRLIISQINDYNDLLKVTEDQLKIAREGVQKTGQAQKTAYDAVLTLENANTLKTENNIKLIKSIAAIGFIALAVYILINVIRS